MDLRIGAEGGGDEGRRLALRERLAGVFGSIFARGGVNMGERRQAKYAPPVTAARLGHGQD